MRPWPDHDIFSRTTFMSCGIRILAARSNPPILVTRGSLREACRNDIAIFLHGMVRNLNITN